MDNQSFISEFLLLELSAIPDLQNLYFFTFLILYLAVIAGNLIIISAIIFDRHLHTPMYFFLMNLAMQDVGSVSVIIPKAMANSLNNTRRISYSGCASQIFFFVFFVVCDFSILTVMAYDRYVGICNLLQYEMVMNSQACSQIVASVWLTGLFCGFLHTCGTFATPFCSGIVNQFFCEVPQLFKLKCSDLYLIEFVTLFLSCLIEFGGFVFVIVTYVLIFSTVMRIPSIHGRQKAFSTCLPHLIVFSTFIITSLLAYMRPPSKTTSDLDLAFTMIYSLVPPILNPVIYSMRNKDIKIAISKLLVCGKTVGHRF